MPPLPAEIIDDRFTDESTVARTVIFRRYVTLLAAVTLDSVEAINGSPDNDSAASFGV